MGQAIHKRFSSGFIVHLRRQGDLFRHKIRAVVQFVSDTIALSAR
jgi:hypothetical protein